MRTFIVETSDAGQKTVAADHFDIVDGAYVFYDEDNQLVATLPQASIYAAYEKDARRK